jgi:hypothetical protein
MNERTVYSGLQTDCELDVVRFSKTHHVQNDSRLPQLPISSVEPQVLILRREGGGERLNLRTFGLAYLELSAEKQNKINM